MNRAPEKTVLFSRHQALGARLVEFAGWELPVQFSSVREEYAAVRHGAGLFDIGHMGVLDVRGSHAGPFLNRIITHDVRRLRRPGQVLYACLCNNDGGTLDDILVYECFGEGYRIIANGANTEHDLAWLREQAERQSWETSQVTIVHRRDLSLVALQGPQAQPVLAGVADGPLDALGFFESGLFTWRAGRLVAAPGPVVISRTGYTGEDGFEIIAPADVIAALWDTLLASGAVPCGLAVRDILRLEAAYCLYGHELDRWTSPLEAALERFVCFNKETPFVGQAALEQQVRDGVPRRRVGLMLDDRGIPRQGCDVLCEGNVVGVVTSGTYSFALERGIAMALVDTAVAQGRPALAVDVRGRSLPAHIVDLPFYRAPKCAGRTTKERCSPQGA